MNTQKWLGIAVLCSLVPVLAGCPTFSRYTTAKAIGDGRNEFAVSAGVTGFNPSVTATNESTNTNVKLDELLLAPTVDISYRRGVGSWFDFGVSLAGLLGRVGVDFKFNFLDVGFLSVAVDPGISGVFIPLGDVGGGYLQIDAPLLVDLAPLPWLRVTLFPQYVGLYVFGKASDATASSFTHFAGGGGSITFRLGDTVSLTPHAGAVVWVNPPDITSIDVSSVLFTAGLAAKFGF